MFSALMSDIYVILETKYSKAFLHVFPPFQFLGRCIQKEFGECHQIWKSPACAGGCVIYISFSLTLSCEGEGFKENLKFIFQQDVESYDPILNPVLNRELRKTGGRILITLGDQEIDFFPKFNIFLSTRNPNVRYKEFSTWCFICK